MKTDTILSIIGGTICLILSAACIHYMILGPMDQQLKNNVQKHLDSNNIGPLDDAFADVAGVPRREKQTDLGLPKAKPVNLDFD